MDTVIAKNGSSRVVVQREDKPEVPSDSDLQGLDPVVVKNCDVLDDLGDRSGKFSDAYRIAILDGVANRGDLLPAGTLSYLESFLLGSIAETKKLSHFRAVVSNDPAAESAPVDIQHFHISTPSGNEKVIDATLAVMAQMAETSEEDVALLKLRSLPSSMRCEIGFTDFSLIDRDVRRRAIEVLFELGTPDALEVVERYATRLSQIVNGEDPALVEVKGYIRKALSTAAELASSGKDAEIKLDDSLVDAILSRYPTVSSSIGGTEELKDELDGFIAPLLDSQDSDYADQIMSKVLSRDKLIKLFLTNPSESRKELLKGVLADEVTKAWQSGSLSRDGFSALSKIPSLVGYSDPTTLGELSSVVSNPTGLFQWSTASKEQTALAVDIVGRLNPEHCLKLISEGVGKLERMIADGDKLPIVGPEVMTSLEVYLSEIVRVAKFIKSVNAGGLSETLNKALGIIEAMPLAEGSIVSTFVSAVDLTHPDDAFDLLKRVVNSKDYPVKPRGLALTAMTNLGTTEAYSFVNSQCNSMTTLNVLKGLNAFVRAVVPNGLCDKAGIFAFDETMSRYELDSLLFMRGEDSTRINHPVEYGIFTDVPLHRNNPTLKETKIMVAY